MDVCYSFDAERGIMTIDGQPVVFHCNHFNRTLQYTIQNAVYVQYKDILVRSAAEVCYLMLNEHFISQPEITTLEKLAYASEVFRVGGYGVMDLRSVAEIDKTSVFEILITSSHYGNALCLNFEPPIVPSEFFDLGYAIGALSAIYEQPFSGEIANCAISMGTETTTLRMHANDKRYAAIFKATPNTPNKSIAPGAWATVPPQAFAPHIDEELIINTFTNAPLLGSKQTGLIPAFGVHLTRMFADYYNLISFRFERQLIKRLELLPELAEIMVFNYPTLFHYRQYFKLEGLNLVKAMLIEAGHVCGFNTMGGIMNSDIWKQLVLPMMKTQDDWIQGITSCINALGWGVWRIIELIPGERLVLRAWHPYESLGYLRWFGLAPHGIDYCMSGVACSLMNLMYEGDITSYPPLTPDYYNKINCSQNSFWVDQTQCVAMGDEYSEIIVTRQLRH
jgi:hypothetical protein